MKPKHLLLTVLLLITLITHSAADGIFGGVFVLPTPPDLLSTTTVSFAADGDTILYTVPANRRCVLTNIIIIAAGDAGATTIISVGRNGAEIDFIGEYNIFTGSLGAQYDAVQLLPYPLSEAQKIKSYPAGTVIEARIANHSGVTGNTIMLFGILY